MRRVLDATAGGARVDVGSDAWSGPGTHEALLLAAGGLLAAVEAVLDGDLDAAFATCARPATTPSGRRDGVLLRNNVAIAARWAQRERGLEKMAILDWDVHHGNGTQATFFDDPSVLLISLHQDGFYPADTGGLESAGRPAGNVNVPLPAGTGDEGYSHAIDRVVGPAMRTFAPDLILVSAGQDASARPARADGDQRARLPGADGPRRGARRRAVRRAGRGGAGGRVLLLHLPLANLAILEGLAGLPADRSRSTRSAPISRRPMRDVERAAVAAAERAHLGA